MRTRDDLRPSQLGLIEEIKTMQSGIAVLGMGGGKTAAALTAINDMIDSGKIRRAIVLAPPRVVDNVWPKEPVKWRHLDQLIGYTIAITGTPARRRKLLHKTLWDVAVVSIDNAQWLVKEIKDAGEDWFSSTLLVIDEMSKFKNPYSKRGRWVMKVAEQFDGVWGLTGTPRPNGIEDLFLPVKMVGGKWAWGMNNFDEWRKRHFYPLDYNGYRWEVHEFMKPKLERIAQEWLVYGPTSDLDLPELYIGDDFRKTVYMTDEQRGHYEQMMGDLFTEVEKYVAAGAVEDPEMELIEAMSQGAASMKLTQIVQGFLYNDEGEPIPLKSNPKLDELADMHDNLGGDRAIITYGFRAEIDQLKKLFSDCRVGVLGGETTTAQANKLIDAWNAGEIDRLLLHPASAGHGVELQFGGHHMIHYHPTWSSELYDQVIKRIHRPGQEHDCFSWWLGMDRSVDDIKWARVQSKLEDEESFRQILRRIT